MEFTNGDFIFHNSYGVGRIKDVKPAPQSNSTEINFSDEPPIADIQVGFQDGETKTFSSELLMRSARKISPEGLRAFAYIDPDGTKELVENDPVEAIAIVLQDFPGLTAKTDEIKDYLSPYVGAWDTWWEKAQPKLKESERIDTTKSKLREYRLRRELLSPAEEVYISFNRLRPFDEKAKVYDQARRVLEKHREGAPLPDEHLREVLNYVTLIIQSEKDPLPLRLDAVFRLQEGKWIDPARTRELLEPMLIPELRLYHLNPYSLNRVVEYLIGNPITEEKKLILAGSICAGEPAIKSIVAWALQKGESEFIALLLTTALSENIPPKPDEDKQNDFAIRLGYAEKLVNALPLENKAWEAIVTSHGNVIRSISRLDQKAGISIIRAQVEFSMVLFDRIGWLSTALSDQIVENLLDLSLPMQFVVSLIDVAQKTKRTNQFGRFLEEKLWATGEQRNYDFLDRMIQRCENESDKVDVLLELMEKNDNRILREKAGEMLCESVREKKLDNPLEYVNRLHHLKGEWSWTTTLESLREKLFYENLSNSGGRVGDKALVSAVKRIIDSELREKDTELNLLKSEFQLEKEHTKNLEDLILEKEQVIRELRSGFGGDTADARFEERVRIVKDLASSIAEFERMVIRDHTKSREIEAILLRLNSLLSGLQVIPMDEIGSKTEFNPQKHRTIDATPIEPGDEVIIFERGFLIRDNRDKLRLLKPALVRKQHTEAGR